MNNQDIFSSVSPYSVKKYVIKAQSIEKENHGEKSTEIERWVVVGTDKNYIVNNDFCTCYSFILDNLKKISICKHIKLLEESKRLKRYDSFKISFKEYEKYRDEMLNEK